MAIRWAACALRLALVWVGVSGRAAAAAPNAAILLDYASDPRLSDCPSSAELSRTVGDQLGYPPFVAGPPATYRVKASIERTASGTEAHIDWLNEQGVSEGERLLTSAHTDCAEIARALSFAIVVQIQLRKTSESRLQAQDAPARPKPTEPATARPNSPQPKASPRMLVLAGAGAFADRGLVPGWGVGLRVLGSVVTPRLAALLSIEAVPATEFALEDGTGFSAHALSVKFYPCVNVSLATACAVGMVGRLQVRGMGVDEVRSPSALIAGVGAGLQRLWLALPRVGALLHIEALAPLTPREVTVNRQPVWSLAPIVVTAGIDLTLIFQ